MKKIVIAIGVLTIMAAIVWAGKAWSTMRVNARTAQFNDEVDNLFSALQQYKEKVGSYPTGGNAAIAKTLQGDNPNRVTILVSRKTKSNEKGEFVDPWGTPWRIYFSDTGVLIRSAGPNRRFDDSGSMDADDFIRSN